MTQHFESERRQRTGTRYRRPADKPAPTEPPHGLRVLTFLSAVLLPMSVVTGLFGTNFALAEYQYAEPFYVMLAGMGVLAAGMLAFMRWQRWL